MGQVDGRAGIGAHHSPHKGASDDWLTPPEIIVRLGLFDLDPCASTNQPWPTATRMICLPEDGLAAEWNGRVWCNPPYGPATWKWLAKLAEHGSGIALTFARTETRGFFAEVWNKAHGLLFIEKRLHFHHPVTGEKAKANSGGPSVLISYSPQDTEALVRSGIKGALVVGWGTI